MILISHRGNIDGINLQLENTTEYIEQALFMGFDVELDVWYKDNNLYLGHDIAEHLIDIQWFEDKKDRLWIHCKNKKAIELFYSLKYFNYFWHNTDTMTFTSKGYIWAYPGQQPINNSIAVLPEYYNDDVRSCIGVCSDYIKNYKNE